jgi:hypothetical protein
MLADFDLMPAVLRILFSNSLDGISFLFTALLNEALSPDKINVGSISQVKLLSAMVLVQK